jgi:hypothetical protein
MVVVPQKAVPFPERREARAKRRVKAADVEVS